LQDVIFFAGGGTSAPSWPCAASGGVNAMLQTAASKNARVPLFKILIRPP
jgi:hypothetical protein